MKDMKVRCINNSGKLVFLTKDKIYDVQLYSDNSMWLVDDLTRQKVKVLEILKPNLNEMLPGYRIDSNYLDGYRQAWEVWVDGELDILNEVINE